MAIGIDELAVQAAFSQPEMDGSFTGPLADYLQDLSGRRPVLLFAFPPKSAGTFLCTSAVVASGGSLVRAVHAQGGREAQLYLPVFLYYYSGGVCAGPMAVHAHMLARPGNCHFIEALSLKPITMIRSIPDMLASLWDMFLAVPHSRTENISGAVPDDFPAFSDARKADFMIDMIGPWYINYFATWLSYAGKRPTSVLVLHFSDWLADPLGTLRRCLDHAGLSQPESVCQAALDGCWKERGELRFNKGAPGRGRSYFTAAHIERLARLMENFSILENYRAELLA